MKVNISSYLDIYPTKNVNTAYFVGFGSTRSIESMLQNTFCYIVACFYTFDTFGFILFWICWLVFLILLIMVGEIKKYIFSTEMENPITFTQL